MTLTWVEGSSSTNGNTPQGKSSFIQIHDDVVVDRIELLDF